MYAQQLIQVSLSIVDESSLYRPSSAHVMGAGTTRVLWVGGSVMQFFIIESKIVLHEDPRDLRFVPW